MIVPRWDRIPPVKPKHLLWALSAAEKVSGLDPDRIEEGLIDALKLRFSKQAYRLALFARVRALLTWQSLPHVKASDSLMESEAIVSTQCGEPRDLYKEISTECMFRVAAASKHPLDFNGRFAGNLHDSIRAAKQAGLDLAAIGAQPPKTM